MIRFFSIIFLLLPFLLAGQTEVAVPKEKKFGIGLVPQYAITNGTASILTSGCPERINGW